MNRFETRLFSLTRRQQYGITVLTVCLTAVLRWILDPLLGADLPFFFFVFPVVLSCALGGLWPGLFATVLSLVVGDYLFIEPRMSLFWYDTGRELLHGASFLAIGIAFSVVFDWSLRTLKREWLQRNKAQEKIQFYSDLNEALFPLADEHQVMAVSARMLGEHLRVDRCTYSEAETGNDHFLTLANYIRVGASGIEQEDAILDFGEAGRRALLENRPYVVNDIETESVPEADRSKYRRSGIRSWVCMPLEKEGNFVARLSVFQKTPRSWSSEEIRLIRIVANRCWESAVRARAVKRLKDSEDRYRAFLSNSSEAIWRYELDAPIPVTLPEDEQIELFFQRSYLAECNEAFARVHGRSGVDEILGERLTVLLVRLDAEKAIEYSRVFIRSGYRLTGAETREVDIHGNPKYFLSNLIGIVENGALIRAWGTQRDITEQTEAANALRASEEALERLLRQEKAARAEAESANRIKDEFLATVSHELRTPLTAITGWAAMLLDGRMPPAEQRHAIEVIARSAKSQSELIADLLDMSRIVSGKFKLDAGPVGIESVFQAAVEIVQPTAQAKRIALRVVMDGRHRMVMGDPVRLQQAIWNLLSNAVKFTKEGGQIKAELTVASGAAEITIADTGIGIDSQFLPSLFEQFRQADSSSTRRYGGLGLGLAIVRRVVEMHGGTVSAWSPGTEQGSTFKMTLPLMPAEVTEPEHETTESEPEATTAGRSNMLDHVRVLLVEDDKDSLELLKIVLHDNGADVVAAPSVREAVNVFDHWRPDVLVSDIAMPDQDGYQLIEQVRSRTVDQGGNVPAVALTAYARNEDRVRALAAGFQMHITKPIVPKELIAALADLSGRGRP